MGRCAKKIFAVAFAMLFGVCVGETLSPREFLKLAPEEVAKGGEAFSPPALCQCYTVNVKNE